jgi:hypothetical protein
LPPGTFPREGDAASRFDAWLLEYEIASAAHAACRFQESLGEENITGTLRRLVAAHDEMSGALSDRPLA